MEYLSNAVSAEGQEPERSSVATPGRLFLFVGVIQTMLFLVHWFVFSTWFTFWGTPAGISALTAVVGLLSVSFVGTTLLAWRSFHPAVRALYTVSAVWLGLLSFWFVAACLCWGIYAVCGLAGVAIDQRTMAAACFVFAGAAAVYGLINAGRITLTRVTVKLPGLPEAWHGRTAALVSDVHLGHVRGSSFARRIVQLLGQVRPDVIFFTGDLYDGTAVDADRIVAPLADISAPHGAYFVAGNHEEFSDSGTYLRAIARLGIRVLNNEKVTIEGLQIVGVHHGDASDPNVFRSILDSAGLERGRASILLSHEPGHLAVAEQAGVSLQLSGHTHGGQVLPWKWIARLVHGRFAYGLQSLRNLLVYTTFGVGTWGPPMRFGTRSEIVLIGFEGAG